jgi:hypothetical protein
VIVLALQLLLIVCWSDGSITNGVKACSADVA